METEAEEKEEVIEAEESIEAEANTEVEENTEVEVVHQEKGRRILVKTHLRNKLTNTDHNEELFEAVEEAEEGVETTTINLTTG